MENLYLAMFNRSEQIKTAVNEEILKVFWEDFNSIFGEVIQELIDEYPDSYSKMIDYVKKTTARVDLKLKWPKSLGNIDYQVINDLKNKIVEILISMGFRCFSQNAYKYEDDESYTFIFGVADFYIETILKLSPKEKKEYFSKISKVIDSLCKKHKENKAKIKDMDQDVEDVKLDYSLEYTLKEINRVIVNIFVLGHEPKVDDHGNIPITCVYSYPEEFLKLMDVLENTPFKGVVCSSDVGETENCLKISCNYQELKDFYYGMLQMQEYEQGDTRKREIQ